MCLLIATGVAYSDSSKPYPVVVDRSVMTPDARSADETEETVFVVRNERNVFDMMRQRRAAELAKQPADEALQAEAIAPLAVEPETIEYEVAEPAVEAVTVAPEAIVAEVTEPETVVAEAIEPEVIVAAEIIELPEVSEDTGPAVVLAEPIETAATVSSLYQRPDQRSGGASGSDTVEPIALEARNDIPASLSLIHI